MFPCYSLTVSFLSPLPPYLNRGIYWWENLYKKTQNLEQWSLLEVGRGPIMKYMQERTHRQLQRFCNVLCWLEYTWSLFSLIDPSIYHLSTCIKYIYIVVQMVNYLPATQETKVRSLGQEDLLEKGMAYPLQYFCLENFMDGGAWWATVCKVTKSQT